AAPVPAGGTLGSEQPRLVQAAQKRRADPEHLRGPAHGVGGVVLVVELLGRAVRTRFQSHLTLNEGPGAVAPGPRVVENTIYRRVKQPALRTRSELRPER